MAEGKKIWLTFGAMCAILAFISATSGVFAQEITCDSITGNEPEDILAAKMKRCEDDIKLHEEQVAQKQKEAASLTRDLNIIGNNISKTKAEINAKTAKIAGLEKEIDLKNMKIAELEDKAERMRESVSELIRRTNEIEESSLMEILLDNKDISEFFSDLGSFDSIQEAFNKTFDEIRQIKGETEKARADLKTKTDKERQLKALQDLEKKKLETQQKNQKEILTYTKGEEEKYRIMLVQKKALAEKIKNTMLRITGGGELRFEDALKYARVAEQAIGVRAAFLLSVLTQETGMDGVIGRNLGKCFYNTPWNNVSGTVMSDAQKPNFLALLQALKINPNTTPVSCPIKKDGQYGGAMGPAQFMPNTWVLYKSRIELIVKTAPANPFNNLDAFTGTALYLSDGMEGCEITYKTTYSRESCAAAKYYAGGKWRSYMKSYGARVANRAVEIQKDIDVLDSQ